MQLPIGLSLSGEALLAWQAGAAQHLAFSVTRACPLRCEHCIVSTVAPGAAGHATVTGSLAADWAAQMPAVARAGVTRVTFTGGEPLLAPAVLDVLSDAAAEAGIQVTVVTAAHWARSAASTAKVLTRFAHIRNWHLSTDVFHARFIPTAQVLRAARAARERGHNVVIRTAVDKPPTAAQSALCAEIAAGLPAGVGIDVEPVLHEGRAASRPHAPYAPWRRSVPCISTGPVVHDDGAVSPCCGGLADTPEQWPWPLPDARTTPLAQIQRAWREQPAMQLIRAVGFAPMLAWAQAAGAPVADPPPDHPCAICTELWRHPQTVAALRDRLADPVVTNKIGGVYDALFSPSSADQATHHPTGNGEGKPR